MVGWVGRVDMKYTNHSCCCVEAMRLLATSHSGREQLLIHSLTDYRSTPEAEGFGSRPRLRTRESALIPDSTDIDATPRASALYCVQASRSPCQEGGGCGCLETCAWRPRENASHGQSLLATE
jgi:hypothetical protein